MLLQGGCKDVRFRLGIENIVIVAGVFGRQSSVQRVSAGVGDGSGRQTSVQIGVVGVIIIQITVGQRLGQTGGRIDVTVQCINDGGVDIQIGEVGAVFQTVVNNGGYPI